MTPTVHARRAARCAALAIALLAVPAASAQAAPAPAGGLSQPAPPQACFDNGGGGGCTAFGAPSAFAIDALALSPDGKFLYANGNNGGSGVTFSRNAGTGALSVAGGAAGGLTDIVVSPNGANLYQGDRETGSSSGQVTAITRSSSTGLGTAFVNCIDDPSPPNGSCPNGTGLVDVAGIAISPDGKTLYVAARFGGGDGSDGGFDGDGALTAFSTGGDDGALSQIACRPNKVTGGGLCATGAANGLTGANDVVVSPDGKFVYATGGFSSSIVGFDRTTSGPDTGKLPSTVNCLAANQSNGNPFCNAAPGLSSANGLAIAPDGKDVYVASFNQGLAALRRDTVSGVLSFKQCFGSGACTPDPATQNSLRDVTVSADGRTVYAVGGDGTDGWVRSYRRDPATGTLTPLDCQSNLGGNGCTTAAGLRNADAIVATGDGKNVYVGSNQGGSGDGAVAAFKVGHAPSCSNGSATVAAGSAVKLALTCSDPDGNPVTRSVAAGPGHGSLGAIDQAAGTVVYTPAPGFSGKDAVAFKGSDGTNASPVAQVAITVTPVAQPVDAAPTSRIKSVAAKVKSSKLRAFKGTAADDKGVTRVHVSLVRTAGSGRCVTLKARGGFKTTRLVRSKCLVSGFVRATGTTKWTLKLRKPLPRGRYTLTSRATDTAGHREALFGKALRNRIAFQVK